jgi:hypothetical protein
MASSTPWQIVNYGSKRITSRDIDKLLFGRTETGSHKRQPRALQETHAPSLARQPPNSKTGLGSPSKQQFMWAVGGEGWRRGPVEDMEKITEPFPRRRSFHGTISTRKPILGSSSTARHVRAARREFPPIHNSSRNADLALAAGDGDVHLRDIVVVSNGLKALNISTIGRAGSLTISMASTPHIGLPRNNMRTHSIPSIREIDIADVVRPSHQPTFISPVATMWASQMPGDGSMPLMESRPCW